MHIYSRFIMDWVCGGRVSCFGRDKWQDVGDQEQAVCNSNPADASAAVAMTTRSYVPKSLFL